MVDVSIQKEDEILEFEVLSSISKKESDIRDFIQETYHKDEGSRDIKEEK